LSIWTPFTPPLRRGAILRCAARRLPSAVNRCCRHRHTKLANSACEPQCQVGPIFTCLSFATIHSLLYYLLCRRTKHANSAYEPQCRVGSDSNTLVFVINHYFHLHRVRGAMSGRFNQTRFCQSLLAFAFRTFNQTRFCQSLLAFAFRTFNQTRKSVNHYSHLLSVLPITLASVNHYSHLLSVLSITLASVNHYSHLLSVLSITLASVNHYLPCICYQPLTRLFFFLFLTLPGFIARRLCPHLIFIKALALPKEQHK
jgi:hypothetical protein